MLTPARVRRCLEAVLEADLWAGSPSAVQELLQPPEDQPEPGSDGLYLTERERAVLSGIEDDLPRDQIARRVGTSQRTVDRTIAGIQEKLEAPNRYVLGKKVGEQGLDR